MALPQEFEVYGATAAPGGRRTTKSMRIALVSGAVVLTMLAAVAFLAKDTEESNRAIEDYVVSPEDRLSSMVTDMALHANTMSLKDMEDRLEEWRNDPNTILGLPQPARTQMLADVGSSMMVHTSTLADDSTLCAKKDRIINLFDQLLKKLGGEELALNISNGKLGDEFKQALASWLDSESTFRLTVEKAQEAKDGAAYAREQYEKYSTAYKSAKSTLDQILKQNAEERNGLLDERELIKEIMRMIGILHDVDATEKSIAAGGKNSVKGEYGVSDPYSIGKKSSSNKQISDTSTLMEKINKIESISQKVNMPNMGTMLHKLKSSLAEYAESDEVAMILMQMLQDIEDRLRILNNLSASAQKQADEMEAKMIEWQTKLVELSAAKDKAKAEAQAQQLQREKLAGEKKTLGEQDKSEKAAYKLLITPYMKEIYIIQMIKTKIINHCAEVAAAAASS
jgi:hypothetical protein